ncbi:subclass B3 metallo-beta-lactamase [Archangium lansingense]|uniref:Subclass B3 metallo-beta-lactamase n=1 Tax=Archangium lansingense TaxID=2995310 RepID=A0ABT4A3Y5_9BACT|nr:subclass B3 metallo-beta-lactamase [Archangium lansinium]MCY1075699.1 subclass B3 metallo-beta-lactamase [Archangium lansinium]
MRLLALLVPLVTAAAPSVPPDTAPVDCQDCAEWNRPQAPFRVYGNTYYVGVTGLSSVLIDSGEGLILVDGALPQSVERIAEGVRALGFDMRDVKWILNSHAHFDHAGGIAALRRMSGAKVAASPAGAKALRIGSTTPDDPQAGFGAAMRYPAVRDVVTVADGGTVALGKVVVTAHHTPGHTPGATTWTWRSCEGERCVNVVYAESLTAMSAPRFRYGADAARVQQFRGSIEKVRTLPCDVMIPTHPEAGRVFELRARSEREGRQAFIDPGACRAYADRADRRLTARLEQEAEGKVE